MQEIDKKGKFLLENINYILAPYYLFDQKDHVVTLNTKKIRKISKDLINLLINYLTDDDNDYFEKYILNLHHDKEYLNEFSNNMYLALEKQSDADKHNFMILLLDNVKKYLNKSSLNSDKLALLQRYYN